jgi:hypothetical protein
VAKIKVKLKTPKIDMLIRSGISSQVNAAVGAKVINMMKEMIAIGLSPVRSYGRFEAYAAQRSANEIKRFAVTQSKNNQGYYRKLSRQTLKSSRLYPNSVKRKYPSKQTRPINLTLSGDYLKTLKHSASRENVKVGHIGVSASSKHGKMFDAHNEGGNQHVPQRKYLPNGPGEKFVVSIERVIKDIYTKALKSILNLK